MFTVVKAGLCVSTEPCGNSLASGIPLLQGNPNPIFWIEVVGGTLNPKNWMKTWAPFDTSVASTDGFRPTDA